MIRRPTASTPRPRPVAIRPTLAALLALSGTAFAQREDPAIAGPGARVSAELRESRSSVATTTSMADLDGARELMIGDVLSFRIIEDEQPVTRLVVTDSGEIDVPYIGLTEARGMTCKQLAAAIKSRLEEEYYHKATVIMGLNYNLYGSRAVGVGGAPHGYGGNVASLAPVQLQAKDGFTIMGLVNREGIYPLAEHAGEDFMLSHAVLRAGGFKPFANDKKVRVLRGGRHIATVNLRDVMKGGKLEKDTPIYRGDVIIVDRRTFNF